MKALEPILSKHLRLFLQHVLCESRGSRYGRLIYWRFDLKRPITFREDGMVPVVQIKSILRILGITVEKYWRVMDGLRLIEKAKTLENG